MKRKRLTVWKADRGEGTIFRFVDEAGQPVSPNLYLSYRAGGREQVCSSKGDDLADAKKDLRRLTRNRENAREGLEVLRTSKVERITVSDLLDANLIRVQEKRLASADKVRYRTATLKRCLGSVRAVDFRGEHVRAYVKRREGAAPATICRELEVLGGAFAYAVKEGTLRYAPHIEKPTVDNVSEREFPQERLEELLEGLRRHDAAIADLVEFMSLTGRRPEGVRKLTWDLLDRGAWTLKIPPEKGGNAVLIGLDGGLREVIERRLSARRPGCDLIFHRGARRMGEDSDRRIFAAVCKELGIPYGREDGFTIYTVKSCAVGLMKDAGLEEGEIMDRSGHRTPSMMRRYLKQRRERAHASSAKLEAYLAGRRALAESGGADAERVRVFPKVSGEA